LYLSRMAKKPSKEKLGTANYKLVTATIND